MEGLIALLTSWLAGGVDWLIVAALGVVVGAGELVSRHRDAPFRAVLVRPAALYLLLNAGASVAALGLIDVSGLGAGQPRWLQVLAAGLGAMLLLRTSISLGTGAEKVTVSISTYFEQFLRAADEEVKRTRGQARGQLVQRVLLDKGVTFARAREALPTECIALHRFVAKEDYDAILKVIDGLKRKKSQLTDRQKVRLMGYELLNVVGPGVLAAAVSDLGAEITGRAELTTAERSEVVRQYLVSRNVSFEKAHAILPSVCISLAPHVDQATRQELLGNVKAIGQLPISNRQKLVLLGYALLDVVDSDVVIAAIGDLGDEIIDDTARLADTQPEPNGASSDASLTSPDEMPDPALRTTHPPTG